MNDRQKELVRILLTNNKEALHVKDISEQLHCSEKTVRNDFTEIEAFLKTYPSASLIRRPGFGVQLEIDKTERLQLFQQLHSKELKSKEERTIEIAYHLLAADKPITLQHLADRYYMHKSAIKKDLEMISRWLGRFGLTIVSKQKLGSMVSGEELNKRSALAHLPELIPSTSRNGNYVFDLFLPYEISTVKRVLTDLQRNYLITFTDGAIESLIVHALIMMKRTRQKSPVFISEQDRESVCKTEEYHYTKWFLEQLESVFPICFPEDELIYFTWHMISCKKREDQSDKLLAHNESLAGIVKLITKTLKQLTMTNFAEDPVLMDGLVVHMHAVINRLTYGFPITNPLLSKIKKMYPYMFSMIALALESVKEKYDLDIPEDEAAYLVLHFQASIERLQKRREITKCALIVCHMGIGMAHLLEAKLEQHYRGIHILGCIGKTEVSDFLETTSVDFIISTVPIENVNVQHVVISPLLEEEDKEKLDTFLLQEKKEATIHDGRSYLSQFIDQDLIFLDVKREHRFEVVEMLANALYEKGFVDMKFNHSMLLRERLSATSIGGTIAIPHGSPSLVKHSTIAVAVLAEPHEWGDEMVSIVFVLAISNDKDNPTKELMKQIVSISEQPTTLALLTKAKNEIEFLSVLDQ